MKPIWYLICFAPGIVALYAAWRNWPWWEDDFEKYFAMFCFPLIGILLAILATGALYGAASGISTRIGNHTSKVWHPRWNGQMVSMRSSDGVSGSVQGGLFMVMGHIDSEIVYSYYTQNKDGSFQSHQWYADSDTAIFEEERKDGEVRQFDIRLKNDWMNWFTEPDDRLRMEFHIPKGSLKQEFKLQ